MMCTYGAYTESTISLDFRTHRGEPGRDNPMLSIVDRDSLARHISAIDGVTYAQACSNCEEMLSFDLSQR